MPQRPAEAGGVQPALAGLPPGLAAEARPAVVQTAGTTRPSEFAHAGSRRRERSAMPCKAVRHNLRVQVAGIMVQSTSSGERGRRIY
jgi:hypothetical protein